MARIMPTIPAGAFLLSILTALPLEGASYKEVPLGDLGYVVSVPARWKSGVLSGEASMILHMRVFHDAGSYSDFDVFALSRNDLSEERWEEYYTRENLPFTYGKFRLVSSESVKAGSFDARLFHVRDLKNKKGYGLMEALVFARERVLFFRYLYSLNGRQDARAVMDRILASLTDAPDALERSRLWYEEDGVLSLERFGLFLRLPQDWTLEMTDPKGTEAFVRVASGGLLQVTFFKRVSSGLKDLKKLLAKHIPGLRIPDELEPFTFGTASSEAFRFSAASSNGNPVNECILGLHGKGGYALVLTTGLSDEVDLLKKVAARALLMNPRDAEAMRRRAAADFKTAVRTDDIAKAREALSTLVLFSNNRTTAGTIAAGLKGSEDIQMASAEALGRIGSKEASKALQKALKNGRVSGAAKAACSQALHRAKGIR